MENTQTTENTENTENKFDTSNVKTAHLNFNKNIRTNFVPEEYLMEVSTSNKTINDYLKSEMNKINQFKDESDQYKDYLHLLDYEICIDSETDLIKVNDTNYDKSQSYPFNSQNENEEITNWDFEEKPKKQIRNAMIYEILKLRNLANYLTGVLKDYKKQENKISISQEAYDKFQEIIEEVESNQDKSCDTDEWDFELEMHNNEVYVNSMEYNGGNYRDEDFMHTFTESFRVD